MSAENIKKSTNRNLIRAKRAKNDEFYTQLSTISDELSNYGIEFFKDKVIYLPFDVAVTDGTIKQSQFVKYFQMNAHRLQYEKLIATCLADKSNTKKINKYVIKRSRVAYCTEESQLSGVSPVAEVVVDGVLYYEYKDGSRRQLAKEVVNEVVRDESGVLLNSDSNETWTNQFWRYTDNLDIIDQDDDYDVSLLQCKPDGVYGSGDFRSEECRRYLEEADIVISNPPFSLFKEVFQWMESAEKRIKFLLLGSINEINFEDIFNLFKGGHCWRGYTIRNGHTKFLVPSDYSTIGERSSESEDGKLVEVSVRWYTNLDERSKT